MKQLGLPLTIFLVCTFTICSLSHAEDDTIYGCYKKNEGQLRIIPKTTQCLPSEVPISWNKVGPPGPPGAAGPTGPPGAQGPQGISVQSNSLPDGDPNCPNGGSLFTSANGVTYACNGETTEGPNIIIRRMETGQCGTDGYGWCPTGFSNSWYFRIRDSAVNQKSVIAINVVNPNVVLFRGCEVSSIGTGEFLIVCNGWNRIEKGAILHYVVFNP